MAEHAKTCFLFLPGGSLTVGKDRYAAWQKKLKQAGISSVSFDYSGVNGSGTSLAESSLALRIEESVCVSDWVKENIRADRYVLYGASMGAYIALGLIHQRQGVFEKVVLYAPAAYSTQAHEVCFGESFTHEIRRKDSWQDSYSFRWLKEYNKGVLLIEAENDEVIPRNIIKKYKSLSSESDNFKSLVVMGASHDIWGAGPSHAPFRDQIYVELIRFLQ